MAYYRLPEKELRAYCEAVMGKYGFNEKQSRDIADILLTADLQGLESHGVQRLIRYHRGVKSGVIRPDAVPEEDYTNLIKSVHRHLPVLNEYIARKGEQIGVSDISQRGSEITFTFAASEAVPVEAVMALCSLPKNRRRLTLSATGTEPKLLLRLSLGEDALDTALTLVGDLRVNKEENEKEVTL